MQARPKILIVEDEPAQREILLYHLKKAGFEALWAENGEEGLLLAQENLPDMLILDWMLPKLSGLEVCRRLRAHQDTKHIPIILLSARSEEADKVQGLDIGADDYVAKPYSVIELMARVKTQLRRNRASLLGAQLRFQDIVLDAAAHKVFRAGMEIKLGPNRIQITCNLYRKARPGAVSQPTFRPGLGPRYLCRQPHSRCACGPFAKVAYATWRR